MAKRANNLPDGAGWEGKRVKYCPKHKALPEFGRVVRMATGKELAMFVLFDDFSASDHDAKLCYARDLELTERG